MKIIIAKLIILIRISIIMLWWDTRTAPAVNSCQEEYILFLQPHYNLQIKPYEEKDRNTEDNFTIILQEEIIFKSIKRILARHDL